MDKVSPPKGEPAREKRALTTEEIRRFCAEAGTLSTRWRTILLLALGTGMRRQELCALTWEDVNFASGTLRINKAIARKNGLNILAPTKNPSSNRTIAVAPELVALLRTWKQEQSAQRLRAPCPWEGSWVFTTSLGNTIPIDKYSHTAAAVYQRAAIPNATFHTLRHPHTGSRRVGQQRGRLSGTRQHADDTGRLWASLRTIQRSMRPRHPASLQLARNWHEPPLIPSPPKSEKPRNP